MIYGLTSMYIHSHLCMHELSHYKNIEFKFTKKRVEDDGQKGKEEICIKIVAFMQDWDDEKEEKIILKGNKDTA